MLNGIVDGNSGELSDLSDDVAAAEDELGDVGSSGSGDESDRDASDGSDSDRLLQDVDTIADVNEKNKDKFDALKDRVDDINFVGIEDAIERCEELKGKVDDNAGEIDDLEADLIDLQNDRSEFDALKSDVEDLQECAS